MTLGRVTSDRSSAIVRTLPDARHQRRHGRGGFLASKDQFPQLTTVQLAQESSPSRCRFNIANAKGNMSMFTNRWL